MITSEWLKTDLERLWLIINKILATKLIAIGETDISLGYLLNAVFWIFIAFWVAKILRFIVSRWLLSHFKLERGNHEAITSIVGYILLVLAFIIALENLGIHLSSLTIFAGGVGIAFGIGLQDLGSNFISGLTLLLGNRLKVGDFISVNHIEGTIERISFRSTLIRNIHDVIIVIPNNCLTKETVINWSYTKDKFRLPIPISFYDDQDPVIITEALVSAAYKETKVLSTPSPQVRFKGYGEGSMDFELLVWLENPVDRDPISPIKSSVYYLINEELKIRNLETAAPKRSITIHQIEKISSVSSPIPVNSNGYQVNHNQNGSFHNYSHQSNTLTQTLPQLETSSDLRMLLKKISYFQDLSNLELRQLIEVGYRHTLEAEEILFNEDDPGDAFYIILSGSVEVFSPKTNKHLTTLKNGTSFGELSLLLGIPRTASVKALEPALLFAINHQAFQTLLQQYNHISESIIKQLEIHQEELTQRKETLQAMGLLEKSKDNSVSWISQRLKNLFSLD
ncbi:cyclic nucleotide-binding domain-containing protein [Crocosphaera sp. Alani8]|uniref:cyclic nucleotide-binding domain-containing protein n=1 Tax=Crocosphaera sp. Alani8 TaxID=3038952 RepID=UPI00313D06D0